MKSKKEVAEILDSLQREHEGASNEAKLIYGGLTILTLMLAEIRDILNKGYELELKSRIDPYAVSDDK